MSEYSTDEKNTGVPDLVDRCAALEAERDQARRLLRDLLDASEAGDDAGWLCAAQDAATALLAGIPVTGYEEMERQRDALEAEVARLRARYEHWWKQAMEARRERNALEAQLAQLHAASDAIFATYHRILALFDCPAHGECAPYAVQRIEGDRARLKSTRALLGELAAFLGHLVADGELFKEDHKRAVVLLRRAEAEAGGGEE